MLAPQFLHFTIIGSMAEFELVDMDEPKAVGRFAEASVGPLSKNTLTWGLVR